MIRSILNIAWVVLGGLLMALGWWLASLLCAITIIGLPWARSCWVIGKFSLWPFGYEAINRKQLTGQSDLGTGTLGLIGNVVVPGRGLVARNRASELGSGLLRHHHRNPIWHSAPQAGSDCSGAGGNDRETKRAPVALVAVLKKQRQQPDRQDRQKPC